MATETTSPADREQDKQSAYAILMGGGLLGGALALGSIIAAYWWWAPLLAWLRDGDREKLWQPLAGIAGLLGGLAIMFATFQAARRFERVDVTLRRVLYGYNAFLTGFLLLLLLIVINAFVHVRAALPYDATEGGFYSLSERTKQYLRNLETPVNVYMMLDPEDPSYDGMKTILTQMEALNPRYFRWEEVNFEGNPSRIRELRKSFKQFAVRPGVLVTYGHKPEDNHSFISYSELNNMDRSEPGSPKRSFNGETRLIQELYFLGEDKKRPTIFFTQGHGEPEMNDHSPDGLSMLVQRLTQANYDCRPLLSSDPDPLKNQVPPEADVVVIVGPKRAMKDMIPALTKYMNPTDPKAKKGKLVVLYGPTGPDRQRANQMVRTDLEDFLRPFGVDTTGEQILMLSGLGGEVPARGNRPYPEAVIIAALQTAAQSRHPLAMLAKDERPLWIDVRHTAPVPAGPGSKFQAEALLATAGFVWTEGDMSKPSLETWQRIRNDPEERQKRLKRDPVPVTVAVTESSGSDDPHGAMKPNEGSTPRMVVFGCSGIATNQFNDPRAAGIEFDLIRGSIDWCRERYTQIGVEPKSYKYFAMPKTASVWNLFYLPLAAMGLGIFGLGLIVWNIRRS